jgi:hypothetical protein
MGSGNFTDEFKRDAVAQTTERGYPVAEVSKRVSASTRSTRGAGSSRSHPVRLMAIGGRDPTSEEGVGARHRGA